MIDFDAPPIKGVIEILLRGLKIDTLSEVKPRVLKTSDEQFLRTRRNAEVFSPSRVVKFMVDALDDQAQFWQSRIEARWLEIACGEAPFITNRYDAESGEDIPRAARAGILDRKFRAIPADFDKIFWAKRAVQSVYGYDIQSDSLQLRRIHRNFFRYRPCRSRRRYREKFLAHGRFEYPFRAGQSIRCS